VSWYVVVAYVLWSVGLLACAVVLPAEYRRRWGTPDRDDVLLLILACLFWPLASLGYGAVLAWRWATDQYEAWRSRPAAVEIEEAPDGR
jgi:hypothetical protein